MLYLSQHWEILTLFMKKSGYLIGEELNVLQMYLRVMVLGKVWAALVLSLPWVMGSWMVSRFLGTMNKELGVAQNSKEKAAKTVTVHSKWVGLHQCKGKWYRHWKCWCFKNLKLCQVWVTIGSSQQDWQPHWQLAESRQLYLWACPFP